MKTIKTPLEKPFHKTASRYDDAAIQAIIDGAVDYEDGECGTHRCIEMYCADHGIPAEVGERAAAEAFKQGALAAGIPLSVIEGKTKLRDHFSQERIESECSFQHRTNGLSRTGDE